MFYAQRTYQLAANHNAMGHKLSFDLSRQRVTLTLTLCCPLLCYGQDPGAQPNNWLVLLVITLLIIQSLLIVGLQKSRVNHKRAKLELAKAHKELESRVVERTQQLEDINNELYAEIASHEKTEALLLKTQDYLHSILNSMPSVLMGITRDGAITHWNTAAESATGLTAAQALGKSLADAYPKLRISPQDIIDATKNRIPIITQNVQQGRGNESRYFDITIYPLLQGDDQTNAVIRLDDVTPRIQMENMLIQNEKMLSLGELAAGLAHEINNPLAAILNSLQNIERRTSDELTKNHEIAAKHGFTIAQLQAYFKDRELLQFIKSIKLAGDQAAKIVTNMLEFSRGNTRQLRYENVNALLLHALEMAENTLVIRNKNTVNRISIISELSDGLPEIPCSATEIQQVILNLLRNANQAFTERQETLNPASNTIWVRTFLDGKHVCIQIEDNGPGMSSDVKEHIFEPFYTTKDVGQGTGLGLSVSYFIITEHHNGEIDVVSQPGNGTCFSIRLPIKNGE